MTRLTYHIIPSRIRAKKTVSFVDRHITKYQDFMADLDERKSVLQETTNMRAHTMNGIKFLDSLSRRKNDVIGFLGKLKTTINDKPRAFGDRTSKLWKRAIKGKQK